MTDHDEPNNDDAGFRAHVDPVVGGEVPDAWDESQSRATGRHQTLIPLPKVEARPWPGRRLVAVAALLLVAVGVIGLGMKLVGSDDDGQRPAGGETDGATGFYVPGTLPPGWEMTRMSMASNSGDVVGLGCPCEVTETRRDDADGGYIAWTSTESPSTSSRDEVRRYPLEGRSGWYEEESGIGTATWRTATGSRIISSPSLDRAKLEALAEAWASDGPPVLDGYHVVDDWSRGQPIENAHSVNWIFTNIETEQNLHVAMGPEMLGTGLLATSTVTLPGNGLTLGIVSDDPEGVSATASWPGNTYIFTMSLSTMAFNDEVDDDYQTTPPPDWFTVQAILGSFQPTDAATWADYLTSPPVGETGPEVEPQNLDLLRTDRINAWLEGPEPGTALPRREVAVIQADPEDPSTDPSASITVESTMDYLAVAEGEPFTVELTMTNRTGATVGVSGCAFGSATWSTVDDNGLVTPADAMDVFCDAGPQPWPDGEQRTQTFEFPGLGSMPDEGPIAAVIQYGDNLSQGVTVVVPGQVGG